MMWWDGGWSWWAWLVMIPVMIGFWAAIGWIVVIAVRGPHDGPVDNEAATANAEQILAERYARGEIDSTDYHQRLDDLRAHAR